MLRRAMWPVLLPVLAYLGGLAGMLTVALTDVPAGPVVTGTFLGMQAVGIVLTAWAALDRHVDRGRRRPWLLILLSWLLWLSAGVGLAAAVTGGSRAAGVLWWGTVAGTIAQGPALFAAVLLFPARPMTGRERLKFALDMATVAGGGFMLTWYFIIGPALSRPVRLDAWTSATLIFPLEDLLVVFGVCAVLLRGAVRSLRHPLATLLAGLTVYLACDVYMSYLTVRNGVHPYQNEHQQLGLGGWMLTGMFLMALAAGQQIRAGLLGRDAGPARWPRGVPGSAQLPFLALGMGYGLLVAALRHGDLFPWAGLVLGVIVMTGAVALRQWSSLRENQRLATTDSLTGLANRVRLRDALDEAVDAGDAAVLLCDLDGFKQINDGYGHETGDQVLIELAGVLRRSLRRADLAARLGGDEFAVVLSGITAPEEAVMVAERILASAREVRIGDAVQGIRMSVGIALTEPGLVPAEVLAHADSAMYAAKRRHSHGWELYAQTAEDLAEGLLADELTNAIRGGRMAVVYQPIVNLADGRMVGAEALVRWPGRNVFPDVFVPLAEKTGLIGELGMFVLREAATHAAAWRATMPEFYVTVNLSAHQLREPGLAERVVAELDRAGLPPRHLVLELTESALVTERTDISVLELLRAHGIRIAIDDFGTGYSSLRYLTRLPVDVLKLDRSFVGELNGEPAGSAVTEAVIRLSQILRLSLVAEGVETEAQVRELLLLGCVTGQGYHFARPLEPAAMDRVVSGGQRVPS
ncbi:MULTISPECIES: putative bifunctional diguanylate cyclase/phosphodiesterase [Catenuloplanes]|uniref:Diguanylate cyclase (GGDEF)-like protein n=1 Tax=Catenuloplanes niger TaxID=587534 RepID=A0AAE4CZ81_9ACTN|nr:bifunctional diguanylate cyclase/phosphodiesterase [Catenuloplanes niger]MDR7326654.1 diguanylate cyclase (GGDEF)-like protein [Catenuloplanes niger]